MVACAEQNDPQIIENADIGKVFLHKINTDQVDATCLKKKLKLLVAKWLNGETVPFRVRVDKNHSLVKKILKQQHIIVKRGTHNKLIIPFSEQNGKILIIENKNYALHAQKNDFINLYECHLD